MTPNANNDDDGYFNDLSRQPHPGSGDSGSPQEQGANGDEGAPRTKRIACVICRKRKLKCDGKRPKCATCDRLGHNCAYDEVRRKSGPKRGYVKDLEARLAQVETQLESKAKKTKPTEQSMQEEPPQTEFSHAPYHPSNVEMSGIQMPEVSFDPMQTTTESFQLPVTSMAPGMMPDSEIMPNLDLNLDESFSWEMISLGLEEPMPTQEAIDELTQIYFETIHPPLPMIHRLRFHVSMDLACERRPPICLRYIMWCHAAAITDKYIHHQDIFYRRARKYIELDEMKGQGEAFVSVAHAQAWALIATYEFKMMYFPRAWMSVGRAARLVLMMGLNRVDGVGLDVKQCLPPPRDWTEREERRRTFWMAYCIDRYASIGTGWPMSIDERDIMTVLPASEEAYEQSRAQQTQKLTEAMTPQQVASLSPFAGVVFVTHFFGLNLTHLHRPEPGQREEDMEGKFWTRHRTLDNSLSQTSMLLPDHLRLPAGLRNPNTVFLNFSLHTSTICLHQAAIFKAEKNQLPNRIIQESRDRCIAAASRIAEIMRLSSDMDVASMNPFLAFCLYVAARVFIQFLKKIPNNTEIRASLDLLLTAMRVLQRKNPLTESFLVQLNLDIEGSGLDVFFHNPDFSTIAKEEANANFLNNRDPHTAQINQHCSPIIHISETSEKSASPADTRFPKWNSPTQQTAAQVDPVHQGQFTFRSVENENVESVKRNMLPGLGAQSRPVPGVFPSESWSEDLDSSRPYGPSPVIPKTTFGSGAFDTEMSDQSGQNNSTGLTPGSSVSYNHSSSNTSFTPPELHHEDSTNLQNAQMPVYNQFNSFALPMGNMYTARNSESSSGRGDANNNSNFNGNTQGNRNSNLQENDPFKLAAGWDHPLGNVTSPVSLTGMTPEGGWANWEG